jgi:lysozyme
MRDMNKLKDMLRRHEGFKSKPYLCTAGKTTIGHGRNIQDKGISKDEAHYLLSNDIADAMVALGKYRWFTILDEVRQSVLIDMAINLGVRKLMEFERTIGHIINAEYDLASEEMLRSRWASQVGDRAVELSEMMLTGEWRKAKKGTPHP